MTNDERQKFIRSLCNSVRDVAIERIKYMPENWDGIEIREYLANLFEAESILRRNPQPDRRRLREVRNDIATRFGL